MNYKKKLKYEKNESIWKICMGFMLTFIEIEIILVLVVVRLVCGIRGRIFIINLFGSVKVFEVS